MRYLIVLASSRERPLTRAVRSSAMCVSHGKGNRASGALANAVTESKPASRASVATAGLGCQKASDGERFLVMTPAGRLSAGKMAPYKHLRPSNYPGQNRPFLRLFHRRNGWDMCRVIRELSGGLKGKWRPRPKSKRSPNLSENPC
jgi:hypothetical protein